MSTKIVYFPFCSHNGEGGTMGAEAKEKLGLGSQ